jgi:hypothetical protein
MQVRRALDLVGETAVMVGVAADDESPVAAAARKPSEDRRAR